VEGEGAPDAAGAVAARAAQAFDAALSDDLNTPEALAAVHLLVNEGNALLAGGGAGRAGAARLREQLASMDAVFGVLLPDDADRLSPDEQGLYDARQDARRRRDWAAADEARAKLLALGIVLEDTAKATRWRRAR
jgi:cysteinyl-tRNA synthetase